MGRWVWWIVAAVVVIGGIYASVEPVAVFGYDDGALAESLEGETDAHGSTDCSEQGDRWLCLIGTDTAAGFGAAFQLTVDDDGCWVAQRVAYGHDKNPPAEEKSGCVDVLDVTGLSGLLDI